MVDGLLPGMEAPTQGRYPILGVFDSAIVVSGEVGLIKPDPAIHLLAPDRFGLGPADGLFIVDTELNVLGARRVTIPVTRFVDEPTLRAHPAVTAYLGGPVTTR